MPNVAEFFFKRLPVCRDVIRWPPIGWIFHLVTVALNFSDDTNGLAHFFQQNRQPFLFGWCQFIKMFHQSGDAGGVPWHLGQLS